MCYVIFFVAPTKKETERHGERGKNPRSDPHGKTLCWWKITLCAEARSEGWKSLFCFKDVEICDSQQYVLFGAFTAGKLFVTSCFVELEGSIEHAAWDCVGRASLFGGHAHGWSIAHTSSSSHLHRIYCQIP